MLELFYEDEDVIVVKKPSGLESQARHSFEPDMVSEIRNHICAAEPDSHSLSPSRSEPYVGVIHRLDRPVSGIMVYARTKSAAAALSDQLRAGNIEKTYRAVVCGRCVDNVGNFVDYLLKNPGENLSKVVEKGTNGAKRAELTYRVLGVLEETVPAWAAPGPLTLVEIRLITGRHHQIRAQFAAHGLPLWGDTRYGLPPRTEPAGGRTAGKRHHFPNAPGPLALCACALTFTHPVSGRTMSFSMEPEAPIFRLFAETAGCAT